MPIEEMVVAKTARIGAKVKRGRDWDWDDQDSSGTGIIEASTKNEVDWVIVRWPDESHNAYRAGVWNTYDLYYAEEKSLDELIASINKLTADEVQIISAALNDRFSEIQRIKKAEFRVSDEVVWEQDEKLIYGKIEKIRKKYIVVKQLDTGKLWSITPTLLQKVK